MTETEPQYSPAYRQAQQDMDAAWSAVDAARNPLKARLGEIVAELQGATGLPPGPNADTLIGAFLDYAGQEVNALSTMASATAAAREAEDRRDAARAETPIPEHVAAPAFLETADPIVVREWLRDANDAEVEQALQDIPDMDARKEWATRLEGWARADGNQSSVFDALRRHTDIDPAGAPDANYVDGPPKQTASADDPPVGGPTGGGAAENAGTDAASGKSNK